MHLYYIFSFLHSGLWNPKKFWIDTFGKISDLPIRISKYAFHIQKSIIKKKAFRIHQSVTKICIPDSEIHNKKKAFQIHQSVTELGFRIQQFRNQ